MKKIVEKAIRVKAQVARIRYYDKRVVSDLLTSRLNQFFPVVRRMVKI